MNKEKLLESLKKAGQYGILRKFMDKEEIQLANELVKEGKVIKGTSDDKQKSVCYFLSEETEFHSILTNEMKKGE